MLPGTNRAADRFVRASFYVNAIPKTDDASLSVAMVSSVMRNVSVPYGIFDPDEPNISSTRWRTVCRSQGLPLYRVGAVAQRLLGRPEEPGFQCGRVGPPTELGEGEQTVYAGEASSKFGVTSRSRSWLYRPVEHYLFQRQSLPRRGIAFGDVVGHHVVVR